VVMNIASIKVLLFYQLYMLVGGHQISETLKLTLRCRIAASDMNNLLLNVEIRTPSKFTVHGKCLCVYSRVKVGAMRVTVYIISNCEADY